MKHGGKQEDKNVNKDAEIAFKLLIDTDKKWEQLLKSTEKPVKSYNCLHEQLIHTKRFQEDAEIAQEFPHLKKDLTAKLMILISDEINLLETTRKECCKLLENLLAKVEKVIASSVLQENSSTTLNLFVNILLEATPYIKLSYLKMTSALCEAKVMDADIPGEAFAYSTKQRQAMERATLMWNFVSTK